MIKIAVIAPKYALLGGAERFAFELTERLSRLEDFSIDVFANEWNSESRSINFHKIPRVLFPRFLRPVFFAYLVNKFASTSYDLIHSHDRVFKMDLMTMHGIPHKAWIKDVRNKSLSLFDRSTAWVEKRGFTTNSSILVMPVSGLAETEILKNYPMLEKSTRVIHPGVNLEKFEHKKKEEARRKIRKMYGLSPQDIVVLFVGMNFEIKRLDLVMKAIARLGEDRSSGPVVKLVVVGKGNAKRYKMMANQLQIAERVIFAGPSEEVENFYFASDIFAMPSKFDTFGMVVLEAMAAGLPSIITKSVGANDLVKNGVHGFVMARDPSVSHLVKAVESLIDPKIREMMGNNARKQAREETWECRAKQVEQIYRQLIYEKSLSK